MNKFHKIIRIILAIALGYFAYSSSFETAWLQTVLYVVAAIFLLRVIDIRELRQTALMIIKRK